jgi:hypothetical protein
VNISTQRRWEYRIDSLLTLNDGWKTDDYSGARVYFPASFELDKGFTEKGYQYRGYGLNRYGMYFTMVSLQKDVIDSEIMKSVLEGYSTGKNKLMYTRIDTLENHIKVFLIFNDTSTNTTNHAIWLKGKDYLYNYLARYPRTADTTGYLEIATSYLNSYSIVNTDSLWIDRMEKISTSIKRSNIEKMDESKNDPSPYCLNIRKSIDVGFYRGPFFRDDGALVLSLDNWDAPDTLRFKDILIVNETMYQYVPESSGQIFYVPADEIPKRNFEINFGYLLKKDSVNECYDFSSHYMFVQPNRKERNDNEKK